jgi:hypothetical protein
MAELIPVLVVILYNARQVCHFLAIRHVKH